MPLRTIINISGFVLVAVGTLGLLLNEFVWNGGTALVLTFAAVNLVGLVSLACSQFCTRD